MFMNSSLDEFKLSEEVERGVDKHRADSLLALASQSAVMLSYLAGFKFVDEPGIKLWIVELYSALSGLLNIFKGLRTTDTIFGVRGAIAYTDKIRHGQRLITEKNPMAGYLGKNDLAFLSELGVFAVVEFKMMRRSIMNSWWSKGATLPQMIC